MDKKELQQLIKEEITKQSFNNGAMKKEELQKLQEALTDVMKYQMDEPDHEGEMAKSQMLKTMKYAADIMNMIDDTTELPAWVQSKLTKIASYIGAVKHHMESKTVRHVVTNMMESEDIKLGDLIKNESVVNERKYGDQTGTKGALLQDKEFSKLISSKERKFIQGNDVKIYKSDAGMIQHFTDGKMEMVVNTKRPMSIVKNLGKASNEIKKVYQQKNESVVKEQSSNRDIKALSYMTGVPDYKIEAFLKRHRLKDLKKVKKLVKGMGIKKDEKFAKMVDGNFSLETEFRRMYKDL